jgi:hypothetical protein
VPIETIDVANQINANGECLPPTNIPAGAIDASTACSVTAQQQVCAESRSNNVAVAATGTITKNADGTSSCTLNNCYDYDPWWRCDIDACDAEMNEYISDRSSQMRRDPFNSTDLSGCDNCPYRKYGRRVVTSQYYSGFLRSNYVSQCAFEEQHQSGGLPTETEWASVEPQDCIESCGWCSHRQLYLNDKTAAIGNWNNPLASQMPVFYRPGMQEEAEALPTVP